MATSSVLERNLEWAPRDEDILDPAALSYPMPTHDLAHLVIRIGESFIYTDLITGGIPDSGKARAAVLAPLG